jgi:predicted TIM-barrel fold metal-dependent hydrolase
MSIKSISTQGKRIDAHCHVFNKEIVSKRIVFSAITEMNRVIESHPVNESETKDEKQPKLKELTAKIHNLNNFFEPIFMSSSTEIAEALDKNYGGRIDCFTPLMFDLTFCFTESYKPSSDEMQIQNSKHDEKLQQAFEELKENLKEHLGSFKSYLLKIATEGHPLFDRFCSWFPGNSLLHQIGELDTEIATLYKYLDLISEHNQKAKNEDASFDLQVKMLLELQHKYPQRIFPFFAVDPRRDGILEEAKNYVVNGTPFLGIKLYTPNGYSPTDPLLFGTNKGDDCLYKFCEDNQIPITAHCSAKGFATFAMKTQVKGKVYIDNTLVDADCSKHVVFKNDFHESASLAIAERANVLNHPKLWEVVLERYPNLYLNLAHFGVGDPERTNGIFKLMQTYKNLYTDLSCISDPATLEKILVKYNSADEYVKSKFLFGSDYFLVLIFTNDFKTYYDTYVSVFGQEIFDKLSITNTNRFLFERETRA